MMRRYRLVFAVMFCFTSLTLFGQPGNPTTDPDAGAVPITGIEWLIAGGCALGLRKLLGFKKLSKE